MLNGVLYRAVLGGEKKVDNNLNDNKRGETDYGIATQCKIVNFLNDGIAIHLYEKEFKGLTILSGA